jgi:hypothetical protein
LPQFQSQRIRKFVRDRGNRHKIAQTILFQWYAPHHSICDKSSNDSLYLFQNLGIPDSNGLRSLCWKLLLGYLGPKKATWGSTLKRKRDLYQQFIGKTFLSGFVAQISLIRSVYTDEMVIPPGQSKNQEFDHPLSDHQTSTWSTFFKDNEFLLQIDKDVRRLCPDISFFQQATDFPCKAVANNEMRLHIRVAPSTLSSANVERKGVGIIKVSRFLFLPCVTNFTNIISGFSH